MYLVSASPEEIVLPLARHLGVDNAIATLARVDPMPAATPARSSSIQQASTRSTAIGADTPKATQSRPFEGSFAYSDSITDLPMFESVGSPGRSQSG